MAGDRATEGSADLTVTTPGADLAWAEWFTAQEPSYQEEVLAARVRARVSVKAGVALGLLFETFGLTVERVAEAARASLARVPRVAQPGAGGQN